MERELDRPFVVGQEVVYNDAGTLRHGIVEQILDTQVPAMVTVRRTDDCNGCRATFSEHDLRLAAAHQKYKMIPPPGAITKARR